MKTLLITMFVAASVFAITAFSRAEESESHEYLMIYQSGPDLVIDGIEVGHIENSVKDQMKSGRATYDYTPLLKKIKEYESAGWKVKTFGTQGSIGHPYFLLEK